MNIAAATARAPQFNTDLLGKIPVLEVPKFPPPPPPDPTKLAGKFAADLGTQVASGAGPQLSKFADEWCGTVPHHFPIPVPKGGSDDGGWCGTVPHPHPPVPPTPPQPWLDLAALAQSFR